MISVTRKSHMATLPWLIGRPMWAWGRSWTAWVMGSLPLGLRLSPEGRPQGVMSNQGKARSRSNRANRPGRYRSEARSTRRAWRTECRRRKRRALRRNPSPSTTAPGTPADHRGQRARHGPDEGVERGARLERGVDDDVAEEGERGHDGRPRPGQGQGQVGHARHAQENAEGQDFPGL